MEKYRAFLMVLETGSFTKAAERMGYSQSALSQMVSGLEKELSLTLLKRSRYGISLTHEGERLLPFVRQAVLHDDALRRAADDIRGLETGEVRIGTISSVSSHWLPPVIERFWERYPHIELVLHQGDYTSIRQWVANGEVDLGFINPVAAKGLETHAIKTDEFCAVLPLGHPLATQDKVSLSDLGEEPYLMLEEGAFSEPMDAFLRTGIKPSVRLVEHDDYSILAMVERGLGYSILARMILDRTDYGVAIRPIEPTVTRTLALATKDQRSLPVAAKEFVRYFWEYAPLRSGECLDGD